MGRIGQTQEIVDAVLYLEKATFVTGEILHVDGGASAGALVGRLRRCDVPLKARIRGWPGLMFRLRGRGKIMMSERR
jgi:hypothetical protein